MSNWARSELHQEAAKYYYDFAARREPEVLRSVAFYLRQCLSRCRQAVHRKDDVLGLSDTSQEQPGPVSYDIIGTLDSHFRCLNEPVTCTRIRPFLAGLLSPSVTLRIPTPITVHLDQCPPCAEDLLTLRELGLGDAQLERLHRLYSHRAAGDLTLCRQARSKTGAFVRGEMEGIDGATLNHMATCLRCRAGIYIERQTLLEKIGSGDGCAGHIATADLFDYAIPSGDAASGAERAPAAHVATCRTCLEAVQAIHRAVFGVIERPESGVATIYSTIGDSEVAQAAPDDPYAEYAVRVQTIHQEALPVDAHVRAAPRRIAFNPHTRRLLKAAVAAAAVVPLALLFQTTHSASGITLGEMARAFGRANNVRVVQINPIDEQVVYELWFSRKLNIAGLAARGKPSFLYDLPGRRKGNLDTDRIDAIDDSEHAYMRRMVDSALGFTVAGIPSDAKWNRIKNDGACDVYELVWTDEIDSGLLIDARYEVTIDRSTTLPVSARTFTKDSLEARWECRSRTMFSYPTDTDLEAALTGGSAAGTQGRP